MRDWMKVARESLGMTSREVSEKVGISEPYYSMIENGLRQKKLDIALASKLSDVFGVSLEYITTRESTPSS